MATSLSTRPGSDEHAPYYGRYIDAVPDTGDLVALLERQGKATVALVRALSEGEGAHRYAPGKWSVKEVVGHVIDAERVFTYRALHIARGDRTPLPSFEQDDWVRDSNAARRPVADLAAELEAVRSATLTLFRGFDDEMVTRRGIASNVEVTPRALAWITAGHERHHRRILREQYLPPHLAPLSGEVG